MTSQIAITRKYGKKDKQGTMEIEEKKRITRARMRIGYAHTWRFISSTNCRHFYRKFYITMCPKIHTIYNNILQGTYSSSFKS